MCLPGTGLCIYLSPLLRQWISWWDCHAQSWAGSPRSGNGFQNIQAVEAFGQLQSLQSTFSWLSQKCKPIIQEDYLIRLIRHIPGHQQCSKRTWETLEGMINWNWPLIDHHYKAVRYHCASCALHNFMWVAQPAQRCAAALDQCCILFLYPECLA